MERAEKKKTVESLFMDHNEIEFYRSIARSGLFEPERRALEKYLKPGSRILDAGCGAGREAVYFAERGHQVTAIDFSRKMIDAARGLASERRQKIRFICGDIESFDCKDKFDLILMLAQFIEHIPGRESRVGLIRRLTTCLSEDGILVLTTHERNISFALRAHWLLMLARARLQGQDYEIGDTTLAKTQGEIKGGGKKMFFHLYTKGEALADIADSGLSAIDVFRDDVLMGDRSQRRDRSYRYFFICKRPSGLNSDEGKIFK